MALRLNYLIVFNLLIFLCFSSVAKEDSKIQFEKQQIQIGSKKINIEIAKTTEQHQYGLMNRNSMSENDGMLFVFETEQPLSFWMKNTYIDLAIAYIDKNKIIVDIQEMKATNQMMVGDLPNYPSAKPALYALEMNKGWFKKNKIKVGQKFNFLKK